MSWRGRVARWCRTYRLDIAWVAFVGINLAAMRLLPDWGTVPFLAIWVSLTAIYGVRLWRLQPTILTWAAVTLATGGIIVVQVLKGQQDADYLAEVPLIALMFLVMVWHGRRRITAHGAAAGRDERGPARLPGKPAPAARSSTASCRTRRMSWARRSRWRWGTPS